MVIQLLSSTTVLTQLEQNLKNALCHSLASADLAQWAETQQWILLEGELRHDRSTSAQVLREVLADITVQWECLVNQHHEQFHPPQIPQFPSQWLTEWLCQISRNNPYASGKSQPMPTILEVPNLELSITAIQIFCEKWSVVEFALFGSVLRPDFRPDSDLDILVSFIPDAQWTLLDLVNMEQELTDLAGRKVGLTEKSAIEKSNNWIRRNEILSTAQIIYSQTHEST